MRRSALSLLAVSLFLTWPNYSPLASAANRANRVKPGSESAADSHVAARQLVETALHCELDGDLAGRALYLREAVEQDTRYSTARWHLGQVQVRDAWLSVDEACATLANERRVKQYHAQRKGVTESPLDQLNLALWCKNRGLLNEGRAHLFAAMRDEPAFGSNIQGFGLATFQGVLMTASQVRQQERQSNRNRIELSKWRPKLVQLSKRLSSFDLVERDRAETELRSLRTASAVPAIESVLSAERPEHTLLAVAALKEIPGQQAAVSLVRHAVFGDTPEVREAAAQALKPRSLYSYAPLLLATLESPVSAHFDNIEQDGAATYRVSLIREEPTADIMVTQDIRFTGSTASVVGQADGSARMQQVTELQRARDRAIIANQTASVTAAVTANNERIKEWNERIAATMTTATNAPTSDRPRDYWQWWYDQNDIYYPPERPVQQVAYNSVSVSPINAYPRVSECFLAGTPVWTSVGAVAIEEIRVGDCVLSQDVETGELAFKPVLSTSLRPPTELLKITFEAEEITATRGHPMWVVGRGWRMARELNPGDRLHTVTGSVEVIGVEPTVTAEAHNLVVAESNSYFVGAAKLLVHDNTIRRHTDVVLPGMFMTE